MERTAYLYADGADLRVEFVITGVYKPRPGREVDFDTSLISINDIPAKRFKDGFISLVKSELRQDYELREELADGYNGEGE